MNITAVWTQLDRLVRPLALLLVCLALTACGDQHRREREGEDLAHVTDQELAEFRNKIKYAKDPRGICYAVLANNTSGFRTTLTFAEVNCGRAGL